MFIFQDKYLFYFSRHWRADQTKIPLNRRCTGRLSPRLLAKCMISSRQQPSEQKSYARFIVVVLKGFGNTFFFKVRFRRWKIWRVSLVIDSEIKVLNMSILIRQLFSVVFCKFKENNSGQLH